MSYIPKKRGNKQPINAPLVAAIDAFMQEDKYPVGIDIPPNWVDGRELGVGEKTIKIPLEINGEIKGQKLIVTTSPNSTYLIFSILITFDPAICRLDFDERVDHSNSHAIGSENIEPIIRGPHYHPWDLNKRFFIHSNKPIELHNAIPLDKNIVQFDSALRWFCDTNKIILNHDHRIELPRSNLLI